MSGIFDTVSRIWSDIRSGHQPLPVVATVPAEYCKPAETVGYPIIRDQMYFTIRINQMHLADNRQWWTAYDPLVVVLSEFNRGQERVAIPTVIGPGLIRKQSPSDEPLYGSVLLDTLVTGPHPYRGGGVDISVSFYRVQRANHATALLKVVDRLSAALSGAGDLALVAKAGGALLEGVQGLLGLEETTYLAGHRIAMALSPLDPFTAGYSALISPPAPRDLGELRVEDRRLYIEADSERRPYCNSDFALLSITGSDARGDENLLPFYPLKVEALAAVWDDGDGVKRGKANLIAAYQQMLRDADVTAAEARRLLEVWIAEFEAERQRAERVRSMPTAPRQQKLDPLVQNLNEAVRRLAL